MSALSDPVGSGLVASLARPGGNTTGLTLDSEEMTGKQLELLKEVVPRVSRVAVLGDPISHAALPRQTAAGAALGLKVQDFLVSHARDLAPTFAAMRQARVGAILVLRDPGVIERNLRRSWRWLHSISCPRCLDLQEVVRRPQRRHVTDGEPAIPMLDSVHHDGSR